MDIYYEYDDHTHEPPTSSWNDWSGMSFTRIMGFSFFASLLQQTHLLDSAKLLLLGSLIETGRRLFQWVIERFRFQYSITAQFNEGDPAYEWILLFLTQENVWRRSRDFRVNAKNSRRKWGVSMKAQSDQVKVDDIADYVPTYEMPQLFRWNGYWFEIKRSKTTQVMNHGGAHVAATIYVTIYTLNMSALSTVVEEARKRYVDVSKPHVTIYIADTPSYGPGFVWNNVKRKSRRPLSSIILLDGVIESLVKDAQEFIAAEDWYTNAGIPHRRGYLLYGPPGTGKTSTIYALAGELGLEIYALSLSSGFVDDSFLQKAASSLPKNSILLIEDIDCAFPTRSEEDEDEPSAARSPYDMGMGMGMGMVTPSFLPGGGAGRRSAVTLSGLLNVLDGVGSEEGKLFFATTNHIDKLDPALLRPGRIDRKVQYNLATKEQAAALYLRFFRESRKPSPDLPDVNVKVNPNTNTDTDTEKPSPLASPSTPDLLPLPTDLPALSSAFATHILQHTFSTAELQGYLLTYKKDPVAAADNIQAWVEREMGERREKQEREEKRKRKTKESRERRYGGGVGGGLGGGVTGLGTGAVMGGGALMELNGVSSVMSASPSSASVDVGENGLGGVPEEQHETGFKVVIDSDQPSKGDTDVGSEGLSTLTSPF